MNRDSLSIFRTACVRVLNDAMRRSLAGLVVVTTGVRELDSAMLIELLAGVQSYDGFTADNDPYGEHDFGVVEVGGTRFFWKIDAYDLTLEAGSPDPTDPKVTKRVLTIMRADEY